MSTVLQKVLRRFDSISMAGMCKNAGKTTAYNRLLSCAEDPSSLALTSIGWDGESVDQVTGTAKPRIYVREGTLLATAAGLLSSCDITREILTDTGMTTPLGEVMVVRARSDGYVQLADPSMVAQQQRLRTVFRRLGAKKVLIDGAAGRKSLCAPGLAQATILCTGASCGRDMEAVVSQTAHACRLLTLGQAGPPALGERAGEGRTLLAGREVIALQEGVALSDGLRKHPDNHTRFVYVDGALTDAMAKPLIQSGTQPGGFTLMARDAGRIFLSPGVCGQLERKNILLAVLESIHLAAVTINPMSATGHHFDPAAFRLAMAEAVTVPVVNVQEEPNDQTEL